MTEHLFSLIPFETSNSPAITIAGRISRQNNLLALHYSLTGDVDCIMLPPPAMKPSRRHELWKATCFEFFLARKDQPQYWEVNLSPSGDWNMYQMDAYRRIGFREESRIQQLQVQARKENERFTLDTAADLNPIFSQDEPVEASITAIIQSINGTETYWALTHTGPQADFHLRQSFILELAGQTHPSNQPAPGD